MATFVPHLQKNFKLKVEDGVPEAITETVGATCMLKVCPLCGSTHHILGTSDGSPYTPLCQIHPELYKAELVAWHKLHPDVMSYKTLHLVEKAA